MFPVDLCVETVQAQREAMTLRVALAARVETAAMRHRAATMATWITPAVSPRSWRGTLKQRLAAIEGAYAPLYSVSPAKKQAAARAWCAIAEHHRLVSAGMRREAAILRRAFESGNAHDVYAEAVACPRDGRPSLARAGGGCLCAECTIDYAADWWRDRMGRARERRRTYRGAVTPSPATRRWLAGRVGSHPDVAPGFRFWCGLVEYQCTECEEWNEIHSPHVCRPFVPLAAYPTRVQGMIGEGSLISTVPDVYVGIEVETQSLPATARAAREWVRVLRHLAAVAKSDCSIRGGEIVTPRIGRSAVWSVCRTLADMLHATGVELSSGAGVHVHVSRPTAPGAEGNVTARMYDVWRRTEDAAFARIAGDHRRTCHYCSPIAHAGTVRAMDTHYAALSRSDAHPTYELRIGGWGGAVAVDTAGAIYRYIAGLVWLAWALRVAASTHSRAASIGADTPIDDLAALVPPPPDYSDVRPY